MSVLIVLKCNLPLLKHVLVPYGGRLFVGVEVLRPSQTSGVMSSAVSLSKNTFTGQAYSSKWLTSIVHLLSPETDNFPS